MILFEDSREISAEIKKTEKEINELKIFSHLFCVPEIIKNKQEYIKILDKIKKSLEIRNFQGDDYNGEFVNF